MNVEEFISDHYGGLSVNHYFYGFFFTKILLFRRLRLREASAINRILKQVSEYTIISTSSAWI